MGPTLVLSECGIRVIAVRTEHWKFFWQWSQLNWATVEEAFEADKQGWIPGAFHGVLIFVLPLAEPAFSEMELRFTKILDTTPISGLDGRRPGTGEARRSGRGRESNSRGVRAP